MTSFSDSLREYNWNVEHGDSYLSVIYHLECVRLATFGNIPPNFYRNLSYIKLARAGFYYTNRCIRCFCCGACISNSHSQPADDDLLNLHHLLNPNCEFLQTLSRRSDCPINYPVTISSNVQNENDLAHRSDETEIKDRTWPQRSTSGAESGYQSTSKLGEFSELQTGACSTRSDPTPSLDYRNFRTRLDSFDNWPKSQSSKELAEAGFYYTGVGDRVRCFCCNYTFLEWKPHERPWEEHSKGSPDCGFVKQNAPIMYQQPPRHVLCCQDSHQSSYHDQPVSTAARIASLEKKVEKQEKRLEDQNNGIRELTNENQNLRNDIESLNEGIQCIICVSNARNILFCPCGHAACCKECYIRLKEGSNNQPTCPTCRQRIVRVYQMFWP